MNRVAVVARYVSDHSFILLYFHFFFEHKFIFKKFNLERSLTVILFSDSQGVSVS